MGHRWYKSLFPSILSNRTVNTITLSVTAILESYKSRLLHLQSMDQLIT